MTVENLDIVAQVEDQFTDPLDEMVDKLLEIDRVAHDVFPIEAEVDIASAQDDLATLGSEVEALDDSEIDVETNVDTDTVSRAASATSVDAIDDGDDLFADLFDPRGGASHTDIDDIPGFGDVIDATQPRADGGEFTQVSGILEEGLPNSDNIDLPGLSQAWENPNIPDIDDDFIKTLANGGDEVGDAVETLRKYDLTMGDLDDSSRSLIQRFDDIELKMGDFFKIFASLLPLLLTFVAAMPAAIAGVVALGAAAVSAAGGLAAIAGLGALGIGLQGGQFSMEPLQQEFEELRRSFIEAFAPLAQTFAPVVRQLTDDIGEMFDAIAARGRVLQRLRDEFAGIGDMLVSVMPTLLANFAALSDAAAPILGKIVRFFASGDFAATFAKLLHDLLPAISQIAQTIRDAIPAIIEISKGFLIWVSVIATGLSLLFQFIDVLGPLGTGLGFVVGTLMTLVTVVSLANNLLAIFTVETSILSGTAIASAVTGLRSMIAGFLGVAESATIATAATAAFISVATIGLGVALAGIASHFSKMNTEMSETQSRLKDLTKGPNAIGTGTLSSSGTTSSGGQQSNPYVQHNHYEVNANGREQANRASYSLSYQTDHRSGQKQDSQYGG